MIALNLMRYTSEGARELMEVATYIHTEIYNEPLFENHPFFSEELFQQRYEKALRRPRFELLMARVDQTIVGYIYGFSLRSEDGWWNNLQWFGDLEVSSRESYTFEDGNRTVVIQELLVMPQWRRLGIARSMHDKFLSSRTEQRAGLRVLPHNTAAKSAYLEWGWATVGTVYPAPESPIFECMIKQLR